MLEKKCAAPITHEGEAVTHVPLGTRLCADGLLRVGEGGEAVAGARPQGEKYRAGGGSAGHLWLEAPFRLQSRA